MSTALSLARQETHNIVDQTFEALEEQFEKEIENRRKAAGVSSSIDLEVLSKKVGKRMREMLEEGQEINSMLRFIETARKFKLEGFSEYARFISSLKD